MKINYFNFLKLINNKLLFYNHITKIYFINFIFFALIYRIEFYFQNHFLMHIQYMISYLLFQVLQYKFLPYFQLYF